jgi:enterochelin esterase-like enzyme
LLHGALDWERTWLDKGALRECVRQQTSAGSASDLIVVMPRESGGLHRGDARVTDFLARDLVGHVDAEFRTLAAPRHRAIDGLSTGGFASVVVGLARPEVFGALGSMSGSYDARAFDALRRFAPSARQHGQRLLLSCGLGEPHLAACRALYEEAVGLGLEAEWAQAPGTHDWPVWRELLGPHLRFHLRFIGK